MAVRQCPAVDAMTQDESLLWAGEVGVALSGHLKVPTPRGFWAAPRPPPPPQPGFFLLNCVLASIAGRLIKLTISCNPILPLMSKSSHYMLADTYGRCPLKTFSLICNSRDSQGKCYLQDFGPFLFSHKGSNLHFVEHG